MVLVKFNKDFKDKETEETVLANTEVEYTVKRAEEIVKTIQDQAEKEVRFSEYKDFGFERVKNDERED